MILGGSFLPANHANSKNKSNFYGNNFLEDPFKIFNKMIWIFIFKTSPNTIDGYFEFS